MPPGDLPLLGLVLPFFTAPSDIPPAVPAGCALTAAYVLSRHGARAPTLAKSAGYATLVARLQTHVERFLGKYAFLKDYRYRLGAEDLTAFGAREMARSGAAFYARYRAVAAAHVPFVRAAGSPRVVASARHFAAGFHRAWREEHSGDAPGRAYPYPILTISERRGSNNTLDHGLCDAFETGAPSHLGDAKAAAWRARFAPAITKRLNQDLPGAELTYKDTVHLMELCAFDTVATPNGRTSPFCVLFTAAEFRDYDYLQAVAKWYGYAHGNPLGPTQGVGWANELVARLTARPVEDRTSVNHTLDADPKTFPLGPGVKLFADFSHDKYVCPPTLCSKRSMAGTDPVPFQRHAGHLRGARPVQRDGAAADRRGAVGRRAGRVQRELGGAVRGAGVRRDDGVRGGGGGGGDGAGAGQRARDAAGDVRRRRAGPVHAGTVRGELELCEGGRAVGGVLSIGTE